MNYVKSALVNLCRLVLALVFILSGYVKAVDPLGTLYKINDYLTAWSMPGILPDWILLGGAVAMSAAEFTLGIALLFAIQRRLVSKATAAIMAVMTAVTIWLYATDGVKDCGCFGDAIILTNGQTLAKNIILLLCAVVVSIWPMRMPRLISRTNQWIVINYTAIFVLLTSLASLYALPKFDFRPYHTGANIRQGMEIPVGAEAPEFETTFTLRKGNVTREFTLDNYPDSTWTFVDSKTVQTKKGYEPPIHDFSITRNDTGDDITDEVLDDKGYTFLLISPHLETADDSNFGDINQISEYAHDHNIPFYCLTASDDKAIARWKDITGADYPFCNTDETTLKTIIRSNPGLVLIKDGTVIRKWSHNLLPDLSAVSGRLEDSETGQMPDDSVPRKIAKLLLGFVLPLALLTIADRLWAWTKWLKKNATKTKYTKSLNIKEK